MLTPDQVKELKAQLSQQIAHLPENQKAQAQQQIDDLSPEALEEMLKQQTQKEDPRGIYRKVISGDIPSKIIDVNKEAVAVLEIRPVTKGHTIIIPKKEIKNAKDLPASVFTLAKKVGKRIVSKMKSVSVTIQTEFKLGETIVNVIPIYDKVVDTNSPRHEASAKELETLQALLIVQPRKPRVQKPKQAQRNILKLSRRIA